MAPAPCPGTAAGSTSIRIAQAVPRSGRSRPTEGPPFWRVLLSGGGESEVVTVPVAWADWALGRRGLYYATGQGVSARRGVFTIQFLDFGSGQTTPLFRSEGIATPFSMAVSPGAHERPGQSTCRSIETVVETREPCGCRAEASDHLGE